MKHFDGIVDFEFHAGQNRIEVEAEYGNFEGVPTITNFDCVIRDADDCFAYLDPDGLYILARDRQRRLTGKLEPLAEAIKTEAINQACRAIDERGAEQMDEAAA